MDEDNRKVVDFGEKSDKSWNDAKYHNQSSASKMVQWIMKYSGGSIKNEEQANHVLIVLIVLLVIASLFMFSRDSSNEPPARALDNPDYGYNPNAT